MFGNYLFFLTIKLSTADKSIVINVTAIYDINNLSPMDVNILNVSTL